MSHSRRATLALRRLAEADPAFAALALWCDHRDAPAAREGGAIAWTDGAVIHYGAAFETLPPHEQDGLAAHQILHVAFRHAARAKGMAERLGERFDAPLFGIATDAIVNETLILAGHALPRPCVELTPLLRASLGEDPGPGAAVARWDAEALYIRLVRPGTGKGESPAARAKDHARAQGHAEDLDWREAEPETAEAAAEWRERILRAMAEGRAAGRGIGALVHRLGDLPRATTPWEVVLRGLLARALSPEVRVGWRRPSRSWLAADAEARARGGPRPAILPGVLRDARIPRIVVGLDCSGSIDDGRLALFAGQVAGIARRLAAETHVLSFDTEVRGRVRMGPGAWEEAIRRTVFARGGGTDFGPVLAEAAALDPSVVVILTDLDGPCGEPPAAPVIWAVPEGPHRPAPFGRVLDLSR